MEIAKDSLVLYKNHPARVEDVGDKLTIRLPDGRIFSVRPKDVHLLHHGPIQDWQTLTVTEGEVETAWELLAGGETTVSELAELVYGEYSPATAWATWELVEEGLYFFGTPQAITVRTQGEVAQRLAAQAAKEARAEAWGAFLTRARASYAIPEDREYLQDVEQLALSKQSRSRVMRELDRVETPEGAHRLLLELKYWDIYRNPYPERFGLPTDPPQLDLPDLPDEDRLDLTHLPAFAIDDVGNQDPDDAISLVDGRLWVHVADVAALIPPHSRLDVEARARGASLYRPEGVVPMLPPQAAERLGLGLTGISPTLSFGLDLDDAGQITGLEIRPSWVRVQRLTYAEVETQLSAEPFASFYRLAQQKLSRRLANNAIEIDLPEIKIEVVDKEVNIRSLPPLQSRSVVREAMLLCGEAVAEFVLQHDIPVAFSTQDPPDTFEEIEGVAGMFAMRRAMKRSQLRLGVSPHVGLGLKRYVQATSPLRRYLDLVVHQQLRAFIRGEPVLDSNEILERIGMADAAGAGVRQAERLAYRHWSLVYLLQRPDWQGEAIIIEKQGLRARLLLPEVDLEAWAHLPRDLPLNSSVTVRPTTINLPLLELSVKIVG